MASPFIISVMFVLSALTGAPIISVLVFDLDHLKRAGIDRHLDAASFPVCAFYLVAAVVDFDAPHHPSVFFREPHYRASWLPICQRHGTVVAGKCSPGRKGREKGQNCQRSLHGPHSV